ncbi:ribosomal protein L5 domain-containing protein [Mycena rebaudengoi]|nr:ribosomal protein L5 domain-containing protein [Mycena rebaudengoi]
MLGVTRSTLDTCFLFTPRRTLILVSTSSAIHYAPLPAARRVSCADVHDRFRVTQRASSPSAPSASGATRRSPSRPAGRHPRHATTPNIGIGIFRMNIYVVIGCLGAPMCRPTRRPMIEPKIDSHQCAINIRSVGESGDRLTRASKVLEQLTTPVTSKARSTIRTFGIRRNEKIAVHVTIRGPKAEEILESGLKVKEHELRRRNLSETGNFGCGMQENIDLGARYAVFLAWTFMSLWAARVRGSRGGGRRRRALGFRIGLRRTIRWRDLSRHYFGTMY